MVYDHSIWTSWGREQRYLVTYSNGSMKFKWFIVHDINQNPFTFGSGIELTL